MGVAYLAEAGLLDGKRWLRRTGPSQATWRRRWPKVLWQVDHFVTEDLRRLGCSGGLYGGSRR